MKLITKWSSLWIVTFFFLGCGSNIAETNPDAKTAAARLLKSTQGAVAIVLNSKGEPIDIYGQTGDPVSNCQLCTKELEAKLGPGCGKSKSTINRLSTENQSPLCTGTVNTTIRNIVPMNIIQHTGSTCITMSFRDGSGGFVTKEYCF